MDYNSTKKLLPEEATRKIHEIARLGYITPTFHFEKRMEQRNYDTQDVDLILSTGKVRKPPEWDSDYDEWKYAVEGNAVEGDKATVIVTIVSPNEIKCITIKPK